jgi:hypothetical protein
VHDRQELVCGPILFPLDPPQDKRARLHERIYEQMPDSGEAEKARINCRNASAGAR